MSEGGSEVEGAGRSRSVVVGAVRYAVLEGDSRLFRSYAVFGSLLAVFVGVMFVLALPVWVLQIAESGGSTLDRVGLGLLWLVGLALIATLVLPMLFVMRRHRQERPERQVAFGLAGYAYVLSIYLALLVSAPEDLRTEPSGALGPVLEALYGLPRVSGLLFPILGTVLLAVIEYGLDR